MKLSSITAAAIALIGCSCQSKTVQSPNPSVTEGQIKKQNDSLEILKRTVPVVHTPAQRDSIIKNYRSIYR